MSSKLMRNDSLQLLQNYVVKIAIGGSTLRNQGAKGVTGTAKDFLKKLDLFVFEEMKPNDYITWLDSKTVKLRQKFPKGATNWGTARKALNIFMIQCFLNKHICKEYGLDKFKDVLEIPLDSYVTKNLRKHAGRGKLPRWEGIIHLKRNDSAKYQGYALQYAKEACVPRACLDIVLWDNGKEKNKQ